MNNKALRLPIILVALMAMVWVIQTFRPHKRLEPTPYRDTAAVATFDASKTDRNLLVNGQRASELTPAGRTTLKSLLNPSSWSLSDIDSIEKVGSRTTLVFIDGSRRDINPSLYQQLPGDLQVRVSYEGPY